METIPFSQAPASYYAYTGHQYQLRTQDPRPAATLSWSSREKLMAAWERWALVTAQLGSSEGALTRNALKARASLLQQLKGAEHRTFGTVAERPSNVRVYVECTWHDPLTIAIVRAGERKSREGLAPELLAAVVQAFPDGFTSALTFSTRHLEWSMSYPALLAILFVHRNEGLLKKAPETAYVDVDNKQAWGQALEASLFGKHSAFWQSNLTEAMDAVLMWGDHRVEDTLVTLRLLAELGGVASLPLIEKSLPLHYGEDVAEGRGSELLERLRAKSRALELDGEWPSSEGETPRPRF